MSDQRDNGIAWTDETWNPLRGCSKVSAGCKHCYAETMAARFAGPGQPYEGTITNGRWNGNIRLVPEKLSEPLRWRRPRKVFVNSMSDLFHEGVPFEFIAAVFGVMAAASQHTFQVLTKRPDRAVEFFAWLRPTPGAASSELDTIYRAACSHVGTQAINASPVPFGWPLPNVWLGVSVEDQTTADARIPLLIQCQAAVHWVSYEPALAAVDFTAHLPRFESMGPGVRGVKVVPGFNWLVVGGESGANARPFDVVWARSAVRQCKAAVVPVFVKQLGARPYNGTPAPGWNVFANGVSCRDRAGADPSEWPEDLRVREWPEVAG